MCQWKLLSNRTLNNDLEKKSNCNLKAQKKQLKKQHSKKNSDFTSQKSQYSTTIFINSS